MGTPYKRVMVKVSGNALFNFRDAAIVKAQQADDVLMRILTQVQHCQQQGIQLVLVCGGGNICRGQELAQCAIMPTTADNVGMLATLVNGLIIRDKLAEIDCPCVLYSAFSVGNMCEQFEEFRARKALAEGQVVICAGGTGNPFVTTDTASTLRAVQTKVEAVIKLTDVDGLYDKDPNKYADARLLSSIGYEYCLTHQIGVMDLLSYQLCQEYHLPIHIASFKAPDILTRLVHGASVGTKISKNGVA